MVIVGTKLKNLQIEWVLMGISGNDGLLLERLEFNLGSITFKLKSYLVGGMIIIDFHTWLLKLRSMKKVHEYYIRERRYSPM